MMTSFQRGKPELVNKSHVASSLDSSGDLSTKQWINLEGGGATQSNLSRCNFIYYDGRSSLYLPRLK